MRCEYTLFIREDQCFIWSNPFPADSPECAHPQTAIGADGHRRPSSVTMWIRSNQCANKRKPAEGCKDDLSPVRKAKRKASPWGVGLKRTATGWWCRRITARNVQSPP